MSLSIEYITDDGTHCVVYETLHGDYWVHQLSLGRKLSAANSPRLALGRDTLDATIEVAEQVARGIISARVAR